jgi:hypothetical protein
MKYFNDFYYNVLLEEEKPKDDKELEQQEKDVEQKKKDLELQDKEIDVAEKEKEVDEKDQEIEAKKQELASKIKNSSIDEKIKILTKYVQEAGYSSFNFDVAGDKNIIKFDGKLSKNDISNLKKLAKEMNVKLDISTQKINDKNKTYIEVKTKLSLKNFKDILDTEGIKSVNQPSPKLPEDELGMEGEEVA